MPKVSDFIDIEAPREEVFQIIAAVERRMQLSPLWGLSELLSISPDYPQPGSRYSIRVLEGAPFGIAGTANPVHGALAGLAQVVMWKMGQEALTEGLPATPEEVPEEPPVVGREQEYFMQTWDPPNRISYALDANCDTAITWKLQDIPRGTRLSYEEEFCPENSSGEDFLPKVRGVVHEWLVNIKRYGELRGTPGRSFARRMMDRYFLKLRPDQRRTVLLILLLQGIAMVTFALAAVGLGIARFFFS